jgi:hypothetical protein
MLTNAYVADWQQKKADPRARTGLEEAGWTLS